MALTKEQQEDKEEGMALALAAIPEEITDIAVRFFHAYAQCNYRFTSSEVMDAFMLRNATLKPDGKGWRDGWGGITSRALRAGIMEHCGYARTPERHRHEEFGKLYQSKVFTGDRSIYPPTELSVLFDLVNDWRRGRERDPMVLAKKAYELGFYCSTI
jgi:hypothetical protein